MIIWNYFSDFFLTMLGTQFTQSYNSDFNLSLIMTRTTKHKRKHPSQWQRRRIHMGHWSLVRNPTDNSFVSALALNWPNQFCCSSYRKRTNLIDGEKQSLLKMLWPLKTWTAISSLPKAWKRKIIIKKKICQCLASVPLKAEIIIMFLYYSVKAFPLKAYDNYL